ncbi:MAG: site-specific integrase, partial [Candidatus Acidiferrales bacterium]
RLSEQYTIRWEDVSFIRRTLTIRRSKNGTTRHVRLNRGALSALKTLQAQGNESKLVCGGTNTPRWWFDPAVKEAGLEGFTWHCLRHTFASRLVMAGVDIRTVQELLGHKTIAMTVRYSHLAPEHNLAAVERLDGPTEQPTDTTTDTSVLAQASSQAAILQ